MSFVIRLMLAAFLFAPLAGVAQDRGDTRDKREEQGRRGERKPKDVQRDGTSDRQKRGSDSIKTPRSVPFRSGVLPLPSDPAPQDPASNQPERDYARVFHHVRDGLASGNYSLFAPHMGSQVTLNLRGGESGSYSANQAYYVLENYFRTRRVLHVEFTTVGESATNPYATGSAGLNIKGSRELVQVYVSLSRTGERWVITQMNIY